MPEKTTARIVVTVDCYDCAPEDVAARMAKQMPDDLAWYSIGSDGEFEIIGAQVAPQS